MAQPASQPTSGAAEPRAVAPVSASLAGAESTDSGPDLSRTRDLYRAADYVGCASAARGYLGFRRGAGPDSAEEIDEARTYLAACLIRAGAVGDGDAAFAEGIRIALEEKRTFSRPNSLVFPDLVLGRFDAVSRGLEKEIEHSTAARISAAQQREATRQRSANDELRRQWLLYDLAARERRVHVNRRWVAAVPFGAGQFQNGQSAMGWLFLTTEALALAGLVGGVAVQLDTDAQYHRAVQQYQLNSVEQFNSRRDVARSVWVTSLWAWAALTAGGILHAQLSFVPERVSFPDRVVPRELRPQKPRPNPVARLSPWISVAERSGFVMGLGGVF